MGLQNEKIAALSFVTADLNYLTPSADRPRTYTFEPPPAGEPKSNIVPEPHGLPIHDVRPISETVSLDREGFALVRQKSSVKDFYNEDEVRSVYYPEARAPDQGGNRCRPGIRLRPHRPQARSGGCGRSRRQPASTRRARACRPHREVRSAARPRSHSG